MKKICKVCNSIVLDMESEDMDVTCTSCTPTPQKSKKKVAKKAEDSVEKDS